jgi:hypothetical protein
LLEVSGRNFVRGFQPHLGPRFWPPSFPGGGKLIQGSGAVSGALFLFPGVFRALRKGGGIRLQNPSGL